MTYKEWIEATTSKFGVSANEVELILVNQSGIIEDPNANVDVRLAKTALCNEFASILPMANVTEGGYSVSWNMEAVKLYYQQLCNELGIAPVTQPRIRNASNRW